MTLLDLIISLAVVGVVLWAVNAIPQIDAGVKKVINIAVIVIVVLWLLVHLLPGGGTILNAPIGR